jgi:hypothetical protein
VRKKPPGDSLFWLLFVATKSNSPPAAIERDDDLIKELSIFN